MTGFKKTLKYLPSRDALSIQIIGYKVVCYQLPRIGRLYLPNTVKSGFFDIKKVMNSKLALIVKLPPWLPREDTGQKSHFSSLDEFKNLQSAGSKHNWNSR